MSEKLSTTGTLLLEEFKNRAMDIDTNEFDDKSGVELSELGGSNREKDSSVTDGDGELKAILA